MRWLFKWNDFDDKEGSVGIWKLHFDGEIGFMCVHCVYCVHLNLKSTFKVNNLNKCTSEKLRRRIFFSAMKTVAAQQWIRKNSNTKTKRNKTIALTIVVEINIPLTFRRNHDNTCPHDRNTLHTQFNLKKKNIVYKTCIRIDTNNNKNTINKKNRHKI